MTRLLGRSLIVIALCLAASRAEAQSFVVRIHVVSAGGGTAAGAGYELSGTIGQWEASVAQTGDSFSLRGGFWATTTLYSGGPFTDDELTAGVSVVRAVHLLELRQRTDAARQRFGLAAYNWSDATLSVSTTPIRLVHLIDLRAALAAAYLAAGCSAPAYTDPDPSGAVTVRRVHITELRAAVRAIE